MIGMLSVMLFILLFLSACVLVGCNEDEVARARKLRQEQTIKGTLYNIGEGDGMFKNAVWIVEFEGHKYAFGSDFVHLESCPCKKEIKWFIRGDIKDLPGKINPGDILMVETLLDGFHGGKVSQVTAEWKGDVYTGGVWLENNTAILWQAVCRYCIIPPFNADQTNSSSISR